MNPEPVMPEEEVVDLAPQLAGIEARPLAQRAEAFSALHEQLRNELEDADTDPAGRA
ncbi:hypothetical protein [Cryobacterium sp. Hb1]|uniref:hypothetical protein n=1 Tax=Cryobacterium sp. Hb1 TaxID=1259147 RepID=UPI00141B18DB|nr:hypothetical protein [Cryobacterium sp. Hb1]